MAVVKMRGAILPVDASDITSADSCCLGLYDHLTEPRNRLIEFLKFNR